ncbi:MAG: hypothetical protein PHN19_03970 [Patescibacteria group bacterium]|nr:hypothetical protein [Patescibacteria group bacterium]
MSEGAIGMSPEKAKAIKAAERETIFVDVVENSGLSESKKALINKKLAEVARNDFSFGATKLFLDWLLLEKNRTNNDLEAKKMNSLYIELREELRDLRSENN